MEFGQLARPQERVVEEAEYDSLVQGAAIPSAQFKDCAGSGGYWTSVKSPSAQAAAARCGD